MQIPLKFLFYIKGINVKKFNGLNQLNIILNELTGISNNTQNPLYFDINVYMHRPQVISNQYNFIKYLKVNDKFFTYYNNSPIPKNFQKPLYKILLGILYFPIFINALTIKSDDDSFLVMILIGCTFALVFYYIICFLLFIYKLHNKE